MNLVSHEIQDNLAILKLNRGVTNSLNLELVHQLGENLSRLRSNPEVKAIVLASANDKFFSIGFDIPELLDLPRAEFAFFYSLFDQICLELYTFRKPTVAAITGHAIAGGCILALCCDYRYIAAGRKLMGLNEIKLGVPVPFPADCILRNLIGTRLARDVMDSGEFYPPEELLRIGMVDRVIPAEEALPAAFAKAQELASVSPEAFALVKRNRVDRLEARIRSRLEDRERQFIELWYSEGTRKLLKEATTKF
jgi:enoyl-CoA hydratase/carnithine racemase